MNMNITQKLEGFYSLKVHGGKRGEIDFGTHKNMILDAGITHMLNGGKALRYISVGSGSSQPNPNQAQLDAQFAITDRGNKITSGYVSAEDSVNGKAYGYDRFSVQFDKGAAKGNIAELGVSGAADGKPLWSRSLVLDKSGNPTTITVLEDEFLTVTYEVRRYVNTETSTTTLQYDDDGEMISVECSVLPSEILDKYGWGSSGVDDQLDRYRLGSPGPSTTSDATTSVSGRSITFHFKYKIDEANNIDIKKIGLGSQLIPSGTVIEFNPPLRKTNEFELTIGVTVTIERA